MEDFDNNVLGQASIASPEAIERARLRRNQRNSRARKQAYIQDLEQRWAQCVEQGAQATIEMQKEAKRVQEENRLLRTVLRNQGLDEKAIQHALEAAKQAAGGDVLPQMAEEPGCLGWSNVNPPGEHQSVTAVALPGIENPHATENHEADLSPTLNLFNWLDNLCQIKDAFGAESFDHPFDYAAVPLQSSEFFELDIPSHPQCATAPVSSQTWHMGEGCTSSSSTNSNWGFSAGPYAGGNQQNP